MFKWGKQGFLNDTDSADDGLFKFSIRPAENDKVIDFGVRFMMADCGDKIYLEFDPLPFSREGGTISEWEKCLKFLQDRRDKVGVLRQAVNEFCTAIEQAYDEYETQLKIAEPKKENNA